MYSNLREYIKYIYDDFHTSDGWFLRLGMHINLTKRKPRHNERNFHVDRCDDANYLAREIKYYWLRRLYDS